MKTLRHDHPIVMVNDIAAASTAFGSLGFTVSTRPDIGPSETDVRFIFFGDGSYLELFSFKDSSLPSQHRWWPLLPKGEGWVDYAVHVEDVTVAAEAFRSRRLPVGTVRNSGKSLSDGREWKVAAVDTGIGAGRAVLPMLIEDQTPRERRVRPPGATATIPAAGAGIVGVTVLTADPEGVDEALGVLFGPGRECGPRLAGSRASRLFSFMGRWVELVIADPAGGALAAHLNQRGEGVLEVTIGWPGHTTPGDGALLPTTSTCGARLRLAA